MVGDVSFEDLVVRQLLVIVGVGHDRNRLLLLVGQKIVGVVYSTEVLVVSTLVDVALEGLIFGLDLIMVLDL